MQMINAIVNIQHKNNFIYKLHMQFVTSAPIFWETAFPGPWSVEPKHKCANVFSLTDNTNLLF